MRTGPLLMICAGLCFTLMVACVKVASRDLSAVEIIMWRGFLTVPIVLLMVRRINLIIHRRWLFALRTLLGLMGMWGFYTAARGLSVADHALISKLHPMLVAIIAPFFLGRAERPGANIWWLLVIGLAGSALVIGPTWAVGSRYGLLCAGGAACAAAAHVCVRRLVRIEQPLAMVLYFQVATLAVAAIVILATRGEMPAFPQKHVWLPLLGMSLVGGAGQWLVTVAFSKDRAAVVGAAGYTSPIWALLIDLIAFGASPSLYAILGGLLIIGAGVGVLRASSPARNVWPDPSAGEELATVDVQCLPVDIAPLSHEEGA